MNIRKVSELTGGVIMDALTTVFETILRVIEIIKNFFAQLFPQKDEGEAEEGAEA